MKLAWFFFIQILWLSVAGAQSMTIEYFKKPAPQASLAAGNLSFYFDKFSQAASNPLFTVRATATPYVFNPASLPFFCKIEYDMMKGKKLPFKFRLGDVEYVDEMERKSPLHYSK